MTMSFRLTSIFLELMPMMVMLTRLIVSVVMSFVGLGFDAEQVQQGLA